MRGATVSDRQLLRRATVSVAVQAALAVAVVVLVMAGVVLLVDEHQQQQQADALTRSVWSRADDVRDPPSGVWLVLRTPSGERQVTPGAPDAVDQVDPARLPDGGRRVVAAGQELAIWTGDSRLGRLSAVYDLSPREDERKRLLVSLGFAALIGIAGAAAIGALIGRRAVRPLGEALVKQRRFVADASHELRTPLTVLHTRAQLLRRQLRRDLDPERAARVTPELDRLVQDASNLGDVVTDLLVSAELDHRPHEGAAVDVAGIAVDVCDSLRALADERSVHLTSSVSATEGEATVSGAPAALRRAISSLVDNAIAHTPAGGHVRVDVACSGGGDAADGRGEVRVTVADDGEGLDPAQAHRLVERFARGTTSDSGRRFGLGLALVDEVARAHGGSLGVDGRLGQGATFTLRLPRARSYS